MVTRSSEKSVPDILAEARALLQQHGLHKGSMYPGSRSCGLGDTERVGYRPGMPVCLLAACRVADTGNPWTGAADQAIDALQATLQRQTGRPLGAGSWQDSSSRTLDDVLNLIDDTINHWNHQHEQDVLGCMPDAASTETATALGPPVPVA